MIRTESSGGWQNHDCSIALPYVCKKKPNATAEPIQPGEPGHKGLRTSGSLPSSAFLVLQTNKVTLGPYLIIQLVWKNWNASLIFG